MATSLRLGLVFLSVNLVRVKTLSCRLDWTFKLLRSLQWTVLSSERSRIPAMVDSGEQITSNFASKNLSIQGWANVAFYLHCSYQRLVFSEQRRMLVTDGMTHTHTHTNDQTTVCLWGSAHQGIINSTNMLNAAVLAQRSTESTQTTHATACTVAQIFMLTRSHVHDIDRSTSVAL